MKKAVAKVLVLVLICTLIFSLMSCGDETGINIGNSENTEQGNNPLGQDNNEQGDNFNQQVGSVTMPDKDNGEQNNNEEDEKPPIEEQKPIEKPKKNLTDYTILRVDSDYRPKENGQFILLGVYPQSEADWLTSAKMTNTTDGKGNYKGADGYWYKKITSTKIEYYYNPTTGSTQKEVQVDYYYKIEPIRWRIIAEDNDSLTLLCDDILFMKEYDSTSAFWGESSIRQYLNNDFYNAVFNAEQRSFILNSDVRNDLASTGYWTESDYYGYFSSPDTVDKLYLLSYEEITNTYSQIDKFIRPTNYCVSVDNGAPVYCLRSPQMQKAIDREIGEVQTVNQGAVSHNEANIIEGYSGGNSFVNKLYGIVPCMKITKSGWENEYGDNLVEDCRHNFENAVCKKCGYECISHSYNNGVCKICEYECSHTWINGVCKICSYKCSHKFDDNSCEICGFVCTNHNWENGSCNVCGEKCEHTWNKSGICIRCNYECKHSFKGDTCTICDYKCVHNYVNCVCQRCGIIDHTLAMTESGYCRHTENDKDYILFGFYPQIIKEDSVTVGSVADKNGYYMGSDGEKYAKIIAVPWRSEYRFSNGVQIGWKTAYYFRVEPIRWRVLEERNGTAFLMCDIMIEGHIYDDGGSNNYANSSIRAWLNNEFCNKAFNSLQQELIQVTEVDNSVASTGYSSNTYTCVNTYDKVFLLSYAEVTNSTYGLGGTSRKMKPNDYCKATTAFMELGAGYGYGYWQLRSPTNDDRDRVLTVKTSGKIDLKLGYTVNHSGNGVVPALWIKLQ